MTWRKSARNSGPNGRRFRADRLRDHRAVSLARSVPGAVLAWDRDRVVDAVRAARKGLARAKVRGPVRELAWVLRDKAADAVRAASKGWVAEWDSVRWVLAEVVECLGERRKESALTRATTGPQGLARAEVRAPVRGKAWGQDRDGDVDAVRVRVASALDVVLAEVLAPVGVPVSSTVTRTAFATGLNRQKPRNPRSSLGRDA